MSKDFKHYQYYTEEDYLEDQDFRLWALQPNPEFHEWWQELFSRYPSQKKVAEDALSLLLELKDHFQPISLRNKVLDESFIQKLENQVAGQQASLVAKRPVTLSARRWMFAAASILILVGTFSWFFLLRPGANQQVLTTNYGEWKTYTLPDGSRVKLNANSEIKFAKNWEAKADRRVELKGEAFFEVRKSAHGAKFTVITEDLAVEVLGTVFNVHSRGSETGVFLQEGKVRLDMGEEEKSMVPGEFMAYSAPQKQITQYEKQAAISRISWQEGSLIMQNKPLRKILDEIKEIYGFSIVVHRKELLDEKKTIAIPMDKIEMAIPILEKTLGIPIRLDNNRLVVG